MSTVIYKHELPPEEKFTPSAIRDIILQQREIEDITDFISPKHPSAYSLEQFGYEKELMKVRTVLKEVKEGNKPVVVYMDYDADGITGGSIVWETLHLLGFKIMPYVPHRVHEGYGFSIQGIDRVNEEFDPALIISVDHGITAVEQVKYAQSLGIQVVITDHHTRLEETPGADAIIHIPELSGSGVGYYFARAVYEGMKDQIPEDKKKRLEQYFASDYIAIAATGTIADLVPLTGASRSIAKYGLQAWKTAGKTGLRHMLASCGINQKPAISTYDIGFIIAPRINAVGRLDHAIDALRLLCTTNEIRARDLAETLRDCNTRRQEMLTEAVEDALKTVETQHGETVPKLLAVISEDWHEGVIGLIASRLQEKYYRPVLAMTQHDGLVKGSARSISGFHVTHFLSELKDHLTSYGGHAQAAGFSLPSDNLDAFLDDIKKVSQEMIEETQLVRKYKADMKLSLAHVTTPLVNELENLQPFGVGNPFPTFVSDVEVIDAQKFGKTGDHLKIIAKDAHAMFPMEFIQFNGAEHFNNLSRGKHIQIVYQPEINKWNGKETLRGKIVHMMAHS